jgi:hypothetical protein
MPKGISEEEINKYVEFLNYVVEHASFPAHSDTRKALNWVKLLTFQQTVLLKKMQDLVVGEAKLHTDHIEKSDES